MKTEEQIKAVFDFVRVVQDVTTDGKTAAVLEGIGNTLQWTYETELKTRLD